MVIGIIGGGQLGKMLAQSAITMGYKIGIYDQSENFCAKNTCDFYKIGRFNDYEALHQFCRKCDVITYEFENIDCDVIEKLSEIHNIPQGSKPLKIASDRLLEKQTIQDLGYEVAPFCEVSSLEDLKSIEENLKFPVLYKTRKEGYDGHGQTLFQNLQEFKNFQQEYQKYCGVLEQFISFDLEFSVMIHRNQRGEISTFPIPQNIHRNQILHSSVVPSHISEEIQERAIEQSMDIMRKLDLIGSMCFEYFLVGDRIIFNEMAPRPHNSYHFTLELCRTSQFEQHIRSILNLPLGDTTLIQKGFMINLLGDEILKTDKVLQSSYGANVKIHDYQKDLIKQARKMGHITGIEIEIERIEELLRDE